MSDPKGGGHGLLASPLDTPLPDDDSVVESLSLLFLFGKLKNQYNFWHVIDHFHIFISIHHGKKHHLTY